SIVVARNADRIDQPHLEFARDDRRGYQPAARNGNNPLPRPLFDQSPGQRLGVAVQLLPSDRKVLLILTRAHSVLPTIRRAGESSSRPLGWTATGKRQTLLSGACTSQQPLMRQLPSGWRCIS